MKDWESFKSSYRQILSINNKSFKENNFLFRGQMNSSWKINSSFDRIENDKTKYIKLLEYFELNLKVHQHPVLEIKTYDLILLSAFVQHSGLPTRLIDWTKSPYIAAFFAFSDVVHYNFKGRLCSIYALNKDSIDIHKDKDGLEFVELSYDKINQRMANQLGQFTLAKYNEDNLDDYLENLEKKYGNNDSIWKFNLPVTCVEEALLDLNLMNINYKTIYPDIEGLVKDSVFSVLK